MKDKNNSIWRLFRIFRRNIVIIGIFLIILLALTPGVTYVYFANDIQSTEGIMNKNDTGVTLFDRLGKPFFTLYQAKHKDFIPLSEIPLFTQQALIAMEDKDFYTHKGFSLKSIIRSLITNLNQNNTTTYGGSTITQQLVKNSLLTSEKSFLRKYQELVLAEEIEHRYTKDQILEMYMNSVYFGEGAFGIESSAQVYFGKKAKDLSLNESALLIALLPSPSSLSPLSNAPQASIKRKDIVLQKMVEQEYISSDEGEKAKSAPIAFSTSNEHLNTIAPHFALEVKKELVKKYGEEYISRSGIKVYTTLDLEWQKYAEKVVQDQVIKLADNRVSNGAAIAIDPKNGEILVWVGSYNWTDQTYGKVDIPLAQRQPGSAFKPIIYAAALEKRLITPATLLKDQPTSYKTYQGPYSPQNYDRQFRGQVTVRKALANSLNVPSVEIMAKVGVPSTLKIGRRFGLTTLKDPSQYGLSLVLGTAEVKLLEMTNVYATFANAGVKNEPVTILKIEDKKNNRVFTFHKNPQNVLDAGIAYLISSILSDNAARKGVFGNALTISRIAAVKTGTTENYRDAWTFGYTPNIAIGVWVGNNDGRLMDQIAGSLGAAPIWKLLMEEFNEGNPDQPFSQPPNIVAISICSFTGRASFSYTEYFLEGTQPAIKSCIPPLTPTTTFPAPTLSSTITPHEMKKDKKDKEKDGEE